MHAQGYSDESFTVTRKNMINNKSEQSPASGAPVRTGNERLVAALDVGTTKIVAALGRRNDNGRLEILGYSKSVSKGIRRGEILNPEEASRVIRQVISDLEKKTGYTIRNVFTGIAGEHIRLIKNRTHTHLSGADETVSIADVRRLHEDAAHIGLEAGKEILHVIPQSYTLDNETNILNPVGMMGKRLEANFNIIVGSVDSIRRIRRCVEHAGLNILDIILEPLASSEAVLYSEEKEVGVALVDIGGGTTDVAVFYENTLRYSAVIPFGGNIITQDIRTACGLLENTAEQLKIIHGEALAEQAEGNKVIVIPSEIPGRAEREVSLTHLAGIIQARMEEIIDMVGFHLRNSECEGNLGAGIVLTGGGSMLRHLKQLFTFQTGLEVNIGFPGQHLVGEAGDMNEPLFATVIGLLKKGFDYLDEHPQCDTAESAPAVEQAARETEPAPRTQGITDLSKRKKAPRKTSFLQTAQNLLGDIFSEKEDPTLE